jgi:hypothetical protein
MYFATHKLSLLSPALTQNDGHVDVVLTLLKSGDHRLSTPDDLDRLTATVEALCG